LPDTGVFGNLALLDSSITDEFGERRFNDQSGYVYNFGAIQNLRDLARPSGRPIAIRAKLLAGSSARKFSPATALILKFS
jgi:hypothetical protein